MTRTNGNGHIVTSKTINGSSFLQARNLVEVQRIIPHLCFVFYKMGISLCTNSTLSDRTSVQWLSELRQLWMSVPWWVACELISLMGSHTVPEQQSQSTPTSLGQGYNVCLAVPPTYTSNRGVEQTLNKSQHWMFTPEKNILPLFLLGIKPATFWLSPVWCFTNRTIPVPKTMNTQFTVCSLCTNPLTSVLPTFISLFPSCCFCTGVLPLDLKTVA